MTDNLLRTNYALLLFYVREKYWHHAEEVCLSTIQSTDDHMFRVWRALTLDQQGMVNEALREYKNVESRRFTAIPALMGMQLIYKRNRDQEGVSQTEAKLDGYEVMDHMGGWLQAAALCWAAGDINAARDLLLKFTNSEAAMAYRDEYTNYGTIRAWVDLLSGRGALLEKAGTTFSKMLEMEEAEHAFFQPGENNGGGSDADGRGSPAPSTGGATLKWTDLNAALGYVAFLERKTQLSKAQSLLDRLVVLYPNCSVPPLVGKARLLMQAEDWEQAIEVTRRILARDRDNVEALTLEALYALVKDTRYDAATVRLRKLLEAVKAKEPRNAALLHQFALVFSRLAGDRLDLLNLTTQFSEMACSLESRNGDALCGLGYQQLYKHDYKTAAATFRKAASLTDSLSPLLGAVTCLMQQGDMEEANKQLAFCNELQPANQRNAELCLLNAQMRWRRRGVEEETAVLRALDQAAEGIKHDVTSHAGSGMETYVYLNAPVSLAIAHEYLLHCRNEPPDPLFRRVDPVGEKCARHLEFVVQHLPACMEAQLMLAKVCFVTGEVRRAQTLLKTTLIVQEQPLPEAFLLSSQICQYMGEVKLASRALEQALTLDFAFQEQPLYNLLLGTVQGTTGKSAESLESLKHAFESVKSGATATSSGKPIQPLSVPEHVTLYLQLAQAHLRMRDVDAARTTLAEAAAKFHDSAQAGRVAIAQAMLAARTDVDKSIELLRQVPSSSEYYIAAHSQLGKLFLTQKHNLAMYIQCFQEMAETVPSAQSYVELGEAYNTIQEPEQAIAAYEKAKALSPSSNELSVRVGRALVASHDYAKAIRYYQDALQSDPHLSTVRADLATLLWRLGRIAEAREVITQSPVYDPPTQQQQQQAAATAPEEAVASAIERINLYLLLYKVLRDRPWRLLLDIPGSSGRNGLSDDFELAVSGGGAGGAAHEDEEYGDIALEALLTARTLQQHLVEHQLRSESADVVAEQRVVMAAICAELGTRCAHNTPAPPPAALLMTDKKVEAAAALALQNCVAGRLTQAKEYLQEAIKYDESNERAQLQSALLCRRSGDVDGCEKHCTTLLRMAGGSASAEEAATLLANVYTQQGRVEDAISLFDGLLNTTPQHYEALVDYLVLLYHAGQLDNAKAALDRATAAIPQGQRADPGLSYARGLYAHFGSNNAEALRHFNLARLPADNPWCERALVRMIWIYLVPTTQDLWVRGKASGGDGSPKQQAQHAASQPRRNSSSATSPSSPHGASAGGATNNNSTSGGGDLHENIRYAEQLLLLLPVQSDQRQVLQAFCTMATQREEELATAMHLFLECIVAAETGITQDGKRNGGGDAAAGVAASTAAAAAVKAKPKKAAVINDDDDSDDEDLQLLAQMHTAAASIAQRSNTDNTATLAFALQCKTIHPSAFLGLAISLFVSGQKAAARNVLGRVLDDAKVQLTPPASAATANTAASPTAAGPGKNGAAPGGGANGNEEAAAPSVPAPAALLTCSEDDTLERAMLLQAYMDAEMAQLDSARYLLLQVLAANKGCGAAWDALGMLYERQQKHKDASTCYQKAWELLQESDPAVGYKLGFNYLRGNEPVRAIDVCKHVLAHHAAYPRIEEDVMDVAYSMLRP